MAIATTGSVALTLDFEAKTASGYNAAVEVVKEAGAAFVQALTDAGIKGVEVLGSDVLIGSTFSLVEGAEPPADDDVDDDVDDGDDDGEEVDEAPAPKRRGRPPGSGKKAAAPAAAATDAPKRRGRPPGVKNGQGRTSAAAAAPAGDTPKRRGRPPGVKNGEGKAAQAAVKTAVARKATGAIKKKRPAR
jgi:hypothetical protein